MNQHRRKSRDLRNQNFEGQEPKRRDFTDCDLRGANLRKATLCNADFTRAKLHGVDFAGANLKGANFTEASINDVSEGRISFSGSVNFTGAKIQGADFTKANLAQANFSNIRSGLNDIHPYIVGFFTVLIALCSSFTSTMIITFTIYYLYPKFYRNQKNFVFLFAFVCSVLLIVSLRTLALQLPTAIIKTPIDVHVKFGIGLIAATILIIIGTTINSQDDDPSDIKYIVFLVIIFIFILSLFLGSSIFIEPESLLLRYFPKLGWIVKGLGTTTQGKWLAGIMGAIIGGGLGWWFSKLALQGDRRFSWLWKCYIGLTARGGTIFSGADLTDANFTEASLKGAKFKTEPFHHQKTRCQRTNWYHAENLEYANIDGLGYLTIPKVKRLVTTRQVQKYSPGGNNFSGLNLEGIYLESAHLSEASFVGTNFKEANLRGAWLERAILTNANLNGADLTGATLNSAILTNANLNGADLTGATLTGACLKNVTIDANTKLDGVICKYVFLEELPDERGIKEKLPHDINTVFEQGEFEKRFRHKHKSGTLQLFISGDNNRSALAAAFVQLVEENQAIQIDELIRGITPVDSDILVEVPVPNATDKGGIDKNFQCTAKSQVEIDAAEITQNIKLSENIRRISRDENQSLFDFIIKLIRVIGEHRSSINFSMRDNYGNQAGHVGRDQNHNVTEQDLT